MLQATVYEEVIREVGEATARGIITRLQDAAAVSVLVAALVKDGTWCGCVPRPRMHDVLCYASQKY